MPHYSIEGKAMNAVGKSVLGLVAIAIFCVAAVQGQDDAKKDRKGKKGRKAPDPVAKMVEGIDLTAEQQAKIEELKKEYSPKLAEVQKRRDAIMTRDRKQAERQAKKEAKDAG